jgi:hypothetical protein
MKVHPNVREVVAVYKVDEAEMELSIQLPSNYPLGPVRVESRKQLADSGHWRNQMMQLTFLLTYQVWLSLILFIKRNCISTWNFELCSLFYLMSFSQNIKLCTDTITHEHSWLCVPTFGQIKFSTRFTNAGPLCSAVCVLGRASKCQELL